MFSRLFNWFKDIGNLIIVILIAAFITVFSGLLPEKSNLEKFNSIDINIQTAGINKVEMLDRFKKAPLSTRVPVEHHRRCRFMLVNRQHEKAMAEQFISQMESLDILWDNRKANARCNNILKRLSTTMPENFKAPEKIYILDTPEINACCLPDGTVVVLRGLLENHNDDELAWIIGHELGHGAAHHTAEMLSKSMIQELAINAFIDNDSGFLKIAGTYIAKFITNLKYSRTQEDEADRLALLFMNKAGYNMQGAVTALNKFKAEAGENLKWKEWLSTHPHPENRLKNVKTAIAQLQKNPDHTWGGFKDIMLETAKTAAVEYYMKKINKQ